MKIRKQDYGTANIVGRNIKQKDFVAMLQTAGCDINPTSYSKLEGQIRAANDKELYVIAKVLNTTVDSLFETE